MADTNEQTTLSDNNGPPADTSWQIIHPQPPLALQILLILYQKSFYARIIRDVNAEVWP